MTFYLKYRSQTLDELDLTDVRESLRKVVQLPSIPHAFLFFGPKGTGKTSAARILAKIVNCEKRKGKSEPCGNCIQCTSITKGDNLDVVEIDAASHRGIEEARMLRDAVKLAPASADKKIYIIDEAHMLTTEASNALLKTLEEPPEHVIFILATTNPEKLLPTIKSRTYPIKFSKASNEEIIRSLKRVLKGEKLIVSEENLELIAKSSEGSFRDAIKLMEQLVIGGIDLEGDITKFLFLKSIKSTEQFIRLLFESNEKEAISFIESAVQEGIDIKDFIYKVIDVVRCNLLAKIGIGEGEFINIEEEKLINIIEKLNEAYNRTQISAVAQIPLEIAVVRWCRENNDLTEPRNNGGSPGENPKIYSTSKNRHNDIHLKINKKKSGKTSNCLDEETWKKILFELRPKNASTEALLRAAKPLGFDGNTLTLGVFYTFHKEKLEQHPHRMLLEQTCSYIFGMPVRISCVLTDSPRMISSNDKDGDDNKILKNLSRSVESNVKESGSENGEYTDATPDPLLTEEQDDDIIRIAKEVFGEN